MSRLEEDHIGRKRVRGRHALKTFPKAPSPNSARFSQYLKGSSRRTTETSRRFLSDCEPDEPTEPVLPPLKMFFSALNMLVYARDVVVIADDLSYSLMCCTEVTVSFT